MDHLQEKTGTERKLKFFDERAKHLKIEKKEEQKIPVSLTYKYHTNLIWVWLHVFTKKEAFLVLNGSLQCFGPCMGGAFRRLANFYRWMRLCFVVLIDEHSYFSFFFKLNCFSLNTQSSRTFFNSLILVNLHTMYNRNI